MDARATSKPALRPGASALTAPAFLTAVASVTIAARLVPAAPPLAPSESLGDAIEPGKGISGASVPTPAPKARRFEMHGYTGDEMVIQGQRVVMDLAGMEAPKGAFPALRQHDPMQIVGHVDDAKVDRKDGVRLEGALSSVSQHGREVAGHSDEQFPWQASIGWSVPHDGYEYADNGEKVEVNGRTFTGPLMVARKSMIKEASFVPLGADRSTSAIAAAGALDNRRIEVTRRAKTMPDPTDPKAADDEKDEKDKDDDKGSPKASLKDLKAAFPKHREFALDCAEEGLSILAAKAKFADELVAGRLTVAGSVPSAPPAPAPAKPPSPRQPVAMHGAPSNPQAAAPIDPEARVALPKNAGPAAKAYLSLVAQFKPDIFADKIAAGMSRPLAAAEADRDARSHVSKQFPDAQVAYLREVRGAGNAGFQIFEMQTPKGYVRQ